MRGLKMICSALFVLALASCGRAPDPVGGEDIEAIRERGELIVLTLQSPTTYMPGEDGSPQGYEVELASAFAEALGVEARFVVLDNLRAVLSAISEGHGHIAAAGITITPERAARYHFGPAYKTVVEQAACRRGGQPVRAPPDLAGLQIVVVAGSSYEETLRTLREDVTGISWRPVEAPSALPLLERVQNEELDCTVSDSNLIAHARLQFPELLTPLHLTEDRSLAWVLAPGSDELAAFMDNWFADLHETDFLTRLDERWYGATRRFDYVDVARFVRRIDERLPALRPHFEAAERETGLDWRWLAAQAYQESHWDENAVSVTGVRGVMMLTLATANELEIEDRTDPRQSILGGARYLQGIYERLPADLEGEDRLFQAFAAYNIGIGHLYDARRLTERNGKSKDSWPDVRTVLPLLSDPAYYRSLPRGYARGHEPVQYVRNIRRYRALLDLHVDE